MNWDFMADYQAKRDETLKEHTEKLVDNAKKLLALGYVKQDFFEELVLAAQYHDVGKINDAFQERVQSDHKKFDDQREIGHHILSCCVLCHGEEPTQEEKRVAYAVINHHHYQRDNFAPIKEQSDLLESLLREIFAKMELDFEAIPKERPWSSPYWKTDISPRKLDLRRVLLLGYLNQCDYAASGDNPVEFPNHFLENKMEEFAKSHQYRWNPMQEFCHNHKSDNIVVVAPTGMGKTEGALRWIGNHKGVYILPLRTAINEIYRRVEGEILKKDCIEKRLSLNHGETLDFYLNQDEANQPVDYEKLFRYYNTTRNFSLPLIISTPDQLFDFVFKYPGYELKLSKLAHSKVVIDEIQSYSPELLAYLIYGIQQIIMAGGKVGIFTATLPPFVLDLLQRNSKNNSLEISFEQQAFSHDKKRHHLLIQDSRMQIEDIVQIYYQRPCKILVVCNTIKQAQELKTELENQEIHVKLLHAKFAKKDRKSKEEEIMKDGKSTINGEVASVTESVIWVATQIVEASLDIDFDYLFTEITELNSLFQRLGRCNRKGLKSVEEPNCYVYQQIDPGIIKRKDRGFIDKTLHELSVKAMESLGTTKIMTEKDKQDLIRDYFTLDKIQDSRRSDTFLEEYDRHYKFVADLNPGEIHREEELRSTFRQIISYKGIPRTYWESQEVQGILEKYDSLQQSIKKKEEERPENWKLKKREIQSQLNEYCLNVNLFDLPFYKKGQEKSICGMKIHILEGEYTREDGYKPRRNQEEKIEDNFI